MDIDQEQYQENVSSNVTRYEKCFRDALLNKLEFKAVQAWVHSPSDTRKSRQKKHREKREAEGIRQLNIQLPADMDVRNGFKDLAKAVCENQISNHDLNCLASNPEHAALAARVAHIMKISRVRAWILKIILRVLFRNVPRQGADTDHRDSFRTGCSTQ